MSSDCKTTMDDLLTFIDVLDITGPEPYQTQIVKYFLNCVIKNRTLPYFIESSIQDYVHSHFGILSHQGYYISPASLTEYMEYVEYLMNNHDHLEELFRLWTEVEEYPLVIVCETDKCASFLLQQFPPVERFIQ
jgi:hypothetical protein